MEQWVSGHGSLHTARSHGNTAGAGGRQAGEALPFVLGKRVALHHSTWHQGHRERTVSCHFFLVWGQACLRTIPFLNSRPRA